MPPEKPPNNKRQAANHAPDTQPSLLDQLGLDEEQAPEKRASENHQPENPRLERPGHEETDVRRTKETGAKTEDSPPAEHEEQAEALEDHNLEPLKRAYARYVEIVNDTYNSSFSDARRQAAFKEAAKTHGVKITDLKRYSTAAALGIPYKNGAEHGADTEPEPGAAPLD